MPHRDAETLSGHTGSIPAQRPGAMQLFDPRGRRKYLTPSERLNFLSSAQDAPPPVRTFCETLAFTGCRITEALELTAARVDTSAGLLIFESLKKRQRGIFRAVPVPARLLSALEEVHDLEALRLREGRGAEAFLWSWSRTTAWRRVREVMGAAGISGLHASPKGVRHGFGIKAVTARVPLNMTQKWMGHTRLDTTLIYTDAVGAEEQEIAERMWV